MKNRLFPIVMSICFVLIVGMAFLLSSGPQDETPENDKEAANWLLREFKTPSKINEWLSQQGTKTPPTKSNIICRRGLKQRFPQSKVNTSFRSA